MKKISKLLIIVTLISVAFKPEESVIGKMMPVMECEDFNGKKIALPTDTKDKYTLLGIVFSKDAETDLKSWMNPIYNRFIVKPDNKSADVFAVSDGFDINMYFIPMFNGLNQITSKQSKEKIKSSTDKEWYPYILFYDSNRSLKNELNIDKKDIPYFFVLDKTGKIVYATSGKYDSKKLEKIVDIIEEN